MGKPYDKWVIKIPEGLFMTGVHRFRTKKEGILWRRAYLNASPEIPENRVPKPEKEKANGDV